MQAAINQTYEWDLGAVATLADSAFCIPLGIDPALCLVVFLQVVQKY
jgi:hypothetical protein